ncbi:uncharacterized protein N7482_007917 [Penicillium canariense]|uniref:FHF complex subunit HOOK-interacting protein C-terminal domain-containing protein n=1 Tax=Penicillium canariense TaxID=189055 RepID=A0A9W9HXT0_9EURO|nr:uncharacterized protein N7482_007917 [Penicillium canariense]KAJ5160913.1 hypothetical protein N7482_007917 [Penicillium canariense]
MDFWSRLIGGSRALSKTSRATSPTERLTAFKRSCNALQQIWRSTNTPAAEQSTTHARTYIERLNSILNDESRGPAPHPCVVYAASSQIFVTVTKLALSYYDENVLRSATLFFNTLIDAEVDGVVDNRLFARALVDLVRRADKASDEIEGRLVELLFGIANNIRLQPAILPAWFVPRATLIGQDGESAAPNGTEFAGATRKDEFPLFYLLVEYVHNEGRAGDFARTGLLYLIETASRSKNLEKWLIESDLATLMATGLGALYSQLGGLTFTPTDENVPRIIALSDHANEETALQPALSEAMDAFMSYLLFWQDTIDHCKSAEVNDTLLDHFQVLFLEQLLYPSLLESSDVAGGSTAAVLTYLCRILGSIDQGELVHRILHFLLASSPPPEEQMDMSASRRRSLNVLAALASEAAQPSPSLFNLRDLALLGLHSSNRQTVLATLRLLNVVLQQHHPFARALIHTVPTEPARQRSVGAFNAELEHLLGLGTSLIVEPTLNESYDNYVADATWVLESRLCLPISMDETEEEIPLPLQLQQDDPIIQALLGCVKNFFTNSVIVNLALTGVLMSLASSHLFSLDGWVLVDPTQYDSPAEGSLEEAADISRAYQTPTWPATAAPTLTAALERLVNQARQWQRDLPDFDVLVAARRELLHQRDRPPTPDCSRDPSEPHLPESVGRSRPSYPGSPEPFAPASRGRSPQPISPRLVAPSSRRGESSVRPLESRGSSDSRTAAMEALRQRLATPISTGPPQLPTGESEDTTTETEGADTEQPPVVTLGHVLTNVVILYEFLLELSAVVQARGSLFEEAGYS